MCYPSTSLYEVLHSKAAIFLLNDPLSPFSGGPISLLQERVHLFDSFEQLRFSFDLFKLNQINFKYSSEFSKRYIRSFPYMNHRSLILEQLKLISSHHSK